MVTLRRPSDGFGWGTRQARPSSDRSCGERESCNARVRRPGPRGSHADISHRSDLRGALGTDAWAQQARVMHRTRDARRRLRSERAMDARHRLRRSAALVAGWQRQVLSHQGNPVEICHRNDLSGSSTRYRQRCPPADVRGFRVWNGKLVEREGEINSPSSTAGRGQ